MAFRRFAFFSSFYLLLFLFLPLFRPHRRARVENKPKSFCCMCVLYIVCMKFRRPQTKSDFDFWLIAPKCFSLSVALRVHVYFAKHLPLAEHVCVFVFCWGERKSRRQKPTQNKCRDSFSRFQPNNFLLFLQIFQHDQWIFRYFFLACK